MSNVAGISFEVVLDSESETHELAKLIASQIKVGDVLLLNGPLGAGKTTFVQGLAVELGVEREKVVSPTFVIAQKYLGKGKQLDKGNKSKKNKGKKNKNKGLAVHHLDLYRIEDIAELDPLLRELPGDDGILLVEWATKLGDIVFEESLTINFEYGEPETQRPETQRPETQRLAELTFKGDSWSQRAEFISEQYLIKSNI